jgi:LuxR family transcriptional regulator, maltose regulon positive regulatory protein
VLARVLLASKQADQALGLLEPLHALAVVQGRVSSVIELLGLRAIGLEAVGDQHRALAALAEALRLADPQGYVRVFVDEGPPMAALFRELLASRRLERLTPAVADAVPHGYLTRLAAAFQQAGTPILPPVRRGAVVVPGLAEPLSARELQVLGLLAAGRPNQAIAEELVITLDTVKSHVAHILGKLGVANRTEAVTRARELRLLR